MGLYVNNNRTTAPIGRVEMYNGDNNTTPSAITNQVRVDRLKAAQTRFKGTAPVAEQLKGLYKSAGTLYHPTIKSEYTQEELCGADIKAQYLDVLA